jgi:prepilin-type N-terminal cleavage/methylation domain-containing protein/prepilin-type processing-associated H-X9-DG protein
MKERQRGFTLVELLVVIGIIGILLGLLLTVIGKVKGAGKRAQCVNNLRQWGIATQLFADSNDDFLPPDGAPNGASKRSGWYVDLPKEMSLPPYHEMPWRTNAAIDPGSSVWICPENPRRSNGHNLFHYTGNRHVNGSGVGNRANLTSIEAWDRVVWMFDNGGKAAAAGPNNAHKDAHNDGANFLFLDGHVERFNNNEYWDFSKDRGRTNNRELIWFPLRGGY